MRLKKRPVKEPIVEPVKEQKATIVATYADLHKEDYTPKNYQVQSIDGFISKIKLCIGKPNQFQKEKPIFTSRIKGVFYNIFANVCKTPTSEMVVGVKVVDPILGHTLEITGYNFTKEDGITEFIDEVHKRQVAAHILEEVVCGKS